ncbi:NUDIX hydrolase [Thiohalobacter sp. IOR34]|uniref:NUDIX hydrolase n=1 Tax=Thiohalobacter sp. IOR34 TaxID=3057176 RepID=UPI0025AEF3A6|nr:NUDIX hydrolase [Thiohalobacter sp. IOR34]WJW75064.1 NUDIX hydrolase [Thiohalobacter sp. IOR34]
MKYCSECAAPVSLQVPAGDSRPRYVCDSCRTIHYQNPNIVAGCIVEEQGRILLCRRAIEPRHGLWTLPAGFMENGETSSQAAERETREEANARVRVEDLYTLFDLPHINQVYMLFRARFEVSGFSAGSESLEVGLFAEEEIPWDSLAFPVVKATLRLYFADRAAGAFRLRLGEIQRRAGEPPAYRMRLLEGGSGPQSAGPLGWRPIE